MPQGVKTTTAVDVRIWRLGDIVEGVASIFFFFFDPVTVAAKVLRDDVALDRAHRCG